MREKIIYILLLVSLSSPIKPTVLSTQNECKYSVIVRHGETLSKIAEKYYDDNKTFPAIIKATNEKATTDNSYAIIGDSEIIKPGWKLCIPDLKQIPVPEPSRPLKGPIKIGVAQDPADIYGKSIVKGIRLALEQINNSRYLEQATLKMILEDTQGDGDQAKKVFYKLINTDRVAVIIGHTLSSSAFEVIWKDTESDKTQALEVFSNLINEHEVAAILGPTLSNSAFKANPVAQKAGVPVIASSTTAKGITDIGKYIFRTCLPESAVIPFTIRVTKDLLGLQRVAVMYDKKDASSASGYEVFVEALKAEGVEIIATETLKTGDVDFSAQLTKMKKFKPDAIVV
ncbi:MAG: ABC transporter substrate-binding protein [Desulfobacteraceae bacterium]|nr:ABC transporter substrate-binding protein [Desulfobacteraceae bacterium]